MRWGDDVGEVAAADDVEDDQTVLKSELWMFTLAQQGIVPIMIMFTMLHIKSALLDGVGSGVNVDDDVWPMHEMKTWVISVGKIESLENQNNFGSHSGGSNMLLTNLGTTYKLMKEILVTTTTKLR